MRVMYAAVLLGVAVSLSACLASRREPALRQR